MDSDRRPRSLPKTRRSTFSNLSIGTSNHRDTTDGGVAAARGDAVPPDSTAHCFDCEYTGVAIDVAAKEVELSYSMEKERYDSLVSSSARILTAISILVVCLSTLYKLCFDNLSAINAYVSWIGGKTITVLYLALLIPLLLSLVFALCIQYRFEVRELGSPTQLLDGMMNHANNSMTSRDAKLQFMLTLVQPYHSPDERNDRIMSYLRGFVVRAGISLGVAFAACVCALV